MYFCSENHWKPLFSTPSNEAPAASMLYTNIFAEYKHFGENDCTQELCNACEQSLKKFEFVN